MTATATAAAVADDARRRPYLPGLHGLTPRVTGQLRWLLPDRDEVPTDIHQLNNQALVRYFEEGWGRMATAEFTGRSGGRCYGNVNN